MNLYLPDQLLSIHSAFEKDGIPHAFGGAIAFAYYGQPRATSDIDINIALKVSQHGLVLDSLSALFAILDRATVQKEIMRDAQVRLQWGHIPLDLFFSDIPFHESVAARTREVDFIGTKIPIVSAEDLIILKAAYNRGKDWVDIENMFKVQGPALDEEYLRRWLDEFFGSEDERVRKIESYMRAFGSSPSPERR